MADSINPSVPALEVRSVRKSYGSSLAVDGVSLSIAQGEVFGLLGPNGAGKSSLINMISGLCRITSGEIKIFGFDNQKDFQTTRRLTGAMPQEIVVDNFFNLEKSLMLHSGYYGYNDDPAWRNLLVERLALGPYLKKKPIQLSGGTKRRHMLAKALIHKPKLLILDEPTAGVDVELRHSIWSFVREIRKMGTTVLLTTHYLEEAQEMCDRIGILSQGKLVALDQTQNLLNRIDDKKLQVRFSASIAGSVSTISDLKPHLSDDGRDLSFAISSELPLGPILERIQKLPAQILDIETKKADLEDVFLKLTEQVHV